MLQPRRIVAVASLVVVLLGMPNRLTFGQGKPVFLVTTCPVGQLVEKGRHLVEVAGFRQIAGMVDAMAAKFSQGLDLKRPVIVWLQADEASFQILGAVPVVDLAVWLQSTPLGGGFSPTATGGLQGNIAGRPVFILPANGWAYVSTSEQAVSQRPADPMAIASGLEKQFDLAIEIRPANLPVAVRESALNRLQQFAQFSLQQMASRGSPAEVKLRQASMERQAEIVHQLATEVDSLTIGISAEPGEKRILLEGTTIALPGTKLQQVYAAKSSPRPAFSSFFVPKATASLAGTIQLTPEEIQRIVIQSQLYWEWLAEKIGGKSGDLPETARGTFQAAFQELAELTKRTVSEGNLDMAASVVVQDERLNAVAAARIADGALLDSAIRQLAKTVSQLPDPVDVRMDFSTHGKVRLHAAQVTLPAGTDMAAAFGEKLTVFLGVDEKQVFLALGDKSLPALRKCMDGTGGPAPDRAPPFAFRLAVGDAVGFVAKVKDNDKAKNVAKAFRNVKQPDQLRMSQEFSTDGASKWQMVLDEGVIAGIGAAYAAQEATK